MGLRLVMKTNTQEDRTLVIGDKVFEVSSPEDLSGDLKINYIDTTYLIPLGGALKIDEALIEYTGVSGVPAAMSHRLHIIAPQHVNIAAGERASEYLERI